MFGGNFAPAGWMFCAGQLLPISENETLFNLIGTTYGGDGQSTFGLPDLQGRVPVHAGGPNTYQLGEKGGVESVTINTNSMPTHNHTPNVLTGAGGGANTPTNQTILSDCQTTTTNTYTPFLAANAQVQMNNASIGIVGGSQPHNNIQETLAVSYIISLFGIYPSPN
ncbi:MAG TPA: tail fiber protein [Allosphingosinicella sp.]|nr:tail fiber protein [Allosphingosinicella sp.]